MEKVTSEHKKLLNEVNHKIKNMSGSITIKAAAYTCVTRDIESIRKFLGKDRNREYISSSFGKCN
ncbi:MAG: hypothetical protein J6Y03_04685 [Alphaproteobacteria bacterium]|nr:hypothetical protein [Alphaproteobacteria bacterium]